MPPIFLLLSAFALFVSLAVGTRRPANVLVLIADDLRPEIGAFYDPRRPYSMYSRILTPSLNALAAKSLVLRRAYVQQAICAPSRLSFLTSRRPDTTLIYTIEDIYWRNVAGNLTTLPQFFKLNGYRSIGIGKVFHHGPGSDQVNALSLPSKQNVRSKEQNSKLISLWEKSNAVIDDTNTRHLK
jgi:iduronate 2-sulfatase